MQDVQMEDSDMDDDGNDDDAQEALAAQLHSSSDEDVDRDPLGTPAAPQPCDPAESMNPKERRRERRM